MAWISLLFAIGILLPGCAECPAHLCKKQDPQPPSDVPPEESAPVEPNTPVPESPAASPTAPSPVPGPTVTVPDPETPEWTCGKTSKPAGDRLFGMDILDATEAGSFSENVILAKQAGVGFLSLHVNWSDIETSPGVYSDPYAAFSQFDPLLKAENLKFSLTIRPIDATGKTVPSDLSAVRFNDPSMITRFNAMVDYVFSILDPSLLTSLQIGNEIDGYNTAGEAPEFWSDYGFFLAGIRSHIQSNYPGVKTGFTATHDGITHGTLKDLGVWSAFAGVADVVGVTYYSMNSDFTVKSPDAVKSDLTALSQQFSGSVISLQEVGYQTSDIANSSELKQAQFFCNFFQAWDGLANIRYASALRLNDLSLQAAQVAAGPYGLSSEIFIEYLRTLGLRSFPGKGQNKRAYELIKEQALLRGF